MDQNLMKRQRELTDRLNRYRNEYYNLNSPSVSDAVYDRLFEELQALEKQTGIQMANSPTSTVGYPAVSKLEKTKQAGKNESLDPAAVLGQSEEYRGIVPLYGRASGDVHAQTGWPDRQADL